MFWTNLWILISLINVHFQNSKFSGALSKDWNNLLTDVIESWDIEAFKKAIRGHFSKKLLGDDSIYFKFYCYLYAYSFLFLTSTVMGNTLCGLLI